MTVTNQANYIRFTHANFKGPVWVQRTNIFAFYYSQTHKATHIVGPGTSLIPVLETEEEVLAKLEQTEETENGKPTQGPLHSISERTARKE